MTTSTYSHSQGTRYGPVLLLLPGIALFIVFFLVPFGTLAVHSLFGYSRMSGIIYDLGLGNYRRILSDDHYQALMLRTLWQSLVASLTTLLVGYPVALLLTRVSERAKAVIIMLVISPLLISVVVRSFGWAIILGQNGLIDSAMKLLGLPSAPLLHTPAAVIIGLTNVFLPFMVISIATSLQSINPAVPLAAASLGANRWRVLRHVILPLSLPGILSGLLIVFSLSASAFVTPALLGGANYWVLSTAIYEQIFILQNGPFGAALAVILLAIVLVVLTLQVRLVERGQYRAVFR